MNTARADAPLTVLVLATHGRDAVLAATLLREADLSATIVTDLAGLTGGLRGGAGAVVATEEALRNADLTELHTLINHQPTWADIPIVLLTHRGGGLERNPAARRLSTVLGNVSFLERPFHPMTFVSLVEVALRSRQRQYDARDRLEDLRAAEEALRRANTTLEQRVIERTTKLEQAQAALHQSQKLEAVGQLTGGIAHDFNNLLMVLSGGLDILDRQKEPARRERIIDSMRQATARGANLTKQLLAFSRNQELRPEAVSLTRHITGMQSLLGHALRGDVTVETDLAPGLWPIEVDQTELELVILNLCVNARDAMPKGGIIRIIGRNVDEQEGARVCLTVSDTGTGMSPDIQARVFEPYFTTKDIGKGSGLGLAQVYGFATQSGGSVWIDSQEGVGTSVTLYLPRSDKIPLEAPLRAPSQIGQDATNEVILLVEDDDEVAALTSEMVKQCGYQCHRVANPAAALGALVDGRRIDAIFSDVMMPGGVNGLELAAQIRQKWTGLPIVLTSGHARGFEEDAAKMALSMLPKPYSIEDLDRVLKGILRN